MTSLKSECRKFSPNIFNKNKCQNCFRTKEAHSAEALESNRCTRKVSKCGYLFVAPDWDFTVSINRTKRWQRRWFVLYDDGELTYSVDEHPDTVPQAVIDMNKALEVSDAQEITGNQFAIAITAPEKVHFVKGTSREESNWWYDVLNRIPRSNMRHGGGKHKRNATFPGGSATTIITDHANDSAQSYCASVEDAMPIRQRFTSESVISKRDEDEWTDWLKHHGHDDDVFPTKDSDQTTNSLPILDTNEVEVTPNENLVTKDDNSCENNEKNDADNAKKARYRRYLKREARTLRNQRSRSDGVAKMIPSRDLNIEDTPVRTIAGSATTMEARLNSPVLLRRRHTSDKAKFSESQTSEFMKTLETTLATQTKPVKKSLKKSESLMNIASELSPELRQHISELKRNHSYKGIVRSKKDTSTKEKTSCSPFLQPVRDTSSKSQIFGMEAAQNANSTSSWDAGVDICTQGMVLKKGWLLRRPTILSKDEWSKHWFVLKNASFTYYRDPSAEDCGILDGVLDLNQVTSVEPLDIEKHFAFSLIMWDNKKYFLSTISYAARSSWIKAIQNASNLWDAESRKNFSNEEIVLPDHSFGSPDRPPTEQAQDLSSSDDQSEYFSIIDDGEDEGANDDGTSSPRTLPPSPPVNRTAMSLVKERAKSRSLTVTLPHTDSSKQSQESEDFFKVYQDVYSKLLDNFQLSSSESDDTKKELRNTNKQESNLFMKNYKNGKNRNEETKLNQFPKLEESTLKELSYDLEDSTLLPSLSKTKSFSENIDRLDDTNYKAKYELLKAKYVQDTLELENKIKKERLMAIKGTHMSSYIKVLQKTKRTVQELNEKITDPGESNKISCAEATKDIQLLFKEIERISPCFDKKQKRDSDIKKWKKALSELQISCKSQQQKLQDEQNRSSSLTLEIQKADRTIKDLQLEVQMLKNERLNFTASETSCEGKISTVPQTDMHKTMTERLRVTEDQVRRLKKDLRDSHTSLDDLEIYCFQLKHDLKTRTDSHDSQMGLMTARVDDLTMKLTASERNLRQTKQKMSKLESKQERRRSSLKSKESLSLSKECESKLLDLEQKMMNIESELRFDDKPLSREMVSKNSDGDRTLAKRLSQDSSSGCENTGSLLLRLHSLGMRTKAASESTKRQASTNIELVFDRPKICLQIRKEDDVVLGQEEEDEDDDCGEDWSALSYTTSLTDLQALDGLDSCEVPTSLSDVIECLDQKLENLLSWTKCSLSGMQRHESIFSDNSFSSQNHTNADSSTLSANALEVLDSLSDIKVEGENNLKLCYKTLLLCEIIKSMCRINSYESSQALEKLSLCHPLYKFMESYCNYLHDLENQSSTEATCFSVIETLITISSAPVGTFFSDNVDNFLDMSQQNLERISMLRENTTNLLNQLCEAKNKQFSAIMHTLADIPVQDAEMKSEKLTLYSEDLQISDPLLFNITVIVNQIYNITLCQLWPSHFQNSSFLSCDHFALFKLHQYLRNGLKGEINAVVDDLKKSYPQVREKNALSCSPNSLSYKRIIYGSVALSVLAVLKAITQSILDFLMDDAISPNDFKDYLEILQENLRSKALCFTNFDSLDHERHECHNLFLNQVLEAGMREIKIEGIFYDFHQRKIESLRKEMDSVGSENSKLKSMFDSNKAQIDEYKYKIEQLIAKESCAECRLHDVKIQSMKKLHETELFAVDKKCKEKVDQMQKHLQFVLDQKDEIHAQEVKKLHEQLQSSRNLSSRLEVEYNEQVQDLKDLYQKKMMVTHESINEESVRRRYQSEIEQLKELWEKGLVVIQNSYRQITAEIERRHKQEITMLENEKEKLLQEESQATLTALEVMRKFHAEELQRELTRCKDEFLRKMNSDSNHSECFRQHQETEMEEVKREIMALSEKYSLKCLESASLEERLHSLQQELQEANHQLFDLTARNKQLKIQLSIDAAELKRCLETSGNSPETIESLKIHLKLKEAEIAEQKEATAQSKQELHLAQMHVSLLDVQCEQLYQSLNAERKLREEEVNNLRSRLEAIISASLAHADEPAFKSVGSGVWSPTGSYLCRTPSLSVIPSQSVDKLNISLQSISQSKELIRSPSWPGFECSTTK